MKEKYNIIKVIRFELWLGCMFIKFVVALALKNRMINGANLEIIILKIGEDINIKKRIGMKMHLVII